MQLFQDIQKIHHTDSAVFRIPTKNGDAFMRVSRSNYRNEIRAVVVVDAQKFLALWRRPGSSHDDIAHLSPDTWPSDYKFKDAVEGFSHGEVNPVPLALVHCYEEDEPFKVFKLGLFNTWKHVRTDIRKRITVSFTNGITRTIWLLVEGAESFPVECDLKSADLLQALAGIPGERYQTVESLIPQSKHRGVEILGRGAI